MAHKPNHEINLAKGPSFPDIVGYTLIRCNGFLETSIKPVALSLKNYLFVGFQEAAQKSVVLCSLFGI